MALSVRLAFLLNLSFPRFVHTGDSARINARRYRKWLQRFLTLCLINFVVVLVTHQTPRHRHLVLKTINQQRLKTSAVLMFKMTTFSKSKIWAVSNLKFPNIVFKQRIRTNKSWTKYFMKCCNIFPVFESFIILSNTFKMCLQFLCVNLCFSKDYLQNNIDYFPH